MERLVSRRQLAGIEAAAVRSWPAPETADIGGWLWRHASGGSLRANSVSTLSLRGADFEAAVRAAEHRYRARGAPCRFTVTEASEPGDLDARLASMGYERGEDHATMAKEIAGPARAVPDVAGAPTDVALSADSDPEWLAVYLSGLSPDRRAVAPAILARLPGARAYVSCRCAGAVVGSGLSVADGRLASVQCMATLAGARRQGCASAVLAAIETWAAAQGCTHLYLQAEAANTAALALYQRAGFRIAGRYHLRTKG
ncbi:MAG TPA: GNAT family N-acetyltransferase [Hyphomicrobiaceae bacterium]